MWRYTLKYGNWLDMAEIEIGIMSHQALARSLADIDSFKERRSECRIINWQFTTQNARIKLAYPTVL